MIDTLDSTLTRQWPSPLVRLAAGALLIVAATMMPWATFSVVGATYENTAFRGGPLSSLLVAVGAVSVLLSVWLLRRLSTRSLRLQLIAGCVALGASVVLMLSKISAANHLMDHATTHSYLKTSFAPGAAVGVIAAVVIIVSSAIDLERAKPPFRTR